MTCTALERVDANCIKCALKWLLATVKVISQSRALPLIRLKVLVLVYFKRSYITDHHEPFQNLLVKLWNILVCFIVKDPGGPTQNRAV